MPLDETPKAAGPATDGRAEAETGGARAAPRFAAYIANLDPGSAAALRRGPLTGAGAAAFWRLAAEYASSDAARNEMGWAALVQAIAILTPKGRETDRTPAHDPKVPMGAALYGVEYPNCASPACWALRERCAVISPSASVAGWRRRSTSGSISVPSRS